MRLACFHADISTSNQTIKEPKCSIVMAGRKRRLTIIAFLAVVATGRNVEGLITGLGLTENLRTSRIVPLKAVTVSSSLRPATSKLSKSRERLRELEQRRNQVLADGNSNSGIYNYKLPSLPQQKGPKDTIPKSGYDIDAILKYYDRRPLQVGWRLNSLGLPLLFWYFGLLFDKALGYDKSEQVQRKRGSELRGHLVRSGSVALVKSGQALSLRPDLLKNEIWAEELGQLVDAVGSFSDKAAMRIIRHEMSDMLPRLEAAQQSLKYSEVKESGLTSRVSSFLSKYSDDPILNLFEVYNDGRAVASASIGQVYKAKLRPGPLLEAAMGRSQAAAWGGRLVAIKVQRPDAADRASLDMYLIRRAAEWLSVWRGGDLPAIADQFGMQLFGELDYVQEAKNGERFRSLYGDWDSVEVPASCIELTRKKVLVTEWIDGEKGPWKGEVGKDMVRVGLKCSVDQLLNTGLFHADPHKGNLLMTPDQQLAFIDFGMMADVPEDDRYGLIGLVIGLQQKDLPLVTDNLLKVSPLWV